MGRRRPDWWLEQQHQQQQRDLLEDGCPRNAANARERARMRVLSKAFGRLKTTLPWVPADTKLSKLDTLRLATTYIAHLSSLLTTTERSDSIVDQGETATQVAVTSTQPINYAMTWPYNAHSAAKQCSSPDDDDCRYNCYSSYNNSLEGKSYSTYDTYYKPSINS
ncbi:protein atonal homolog 7-like [Rhopalosiphum maidis]|uniref:protein atonal homolog 7-like n=1 Tax=Rhopalosiphum maidis TaxID=43146 RepID=UPI000EFEBAEF|nr:protein atonal homolog 7-like [Rhopalosiphum maidis]XP_026813249.1 protein atonal homolog 7-like [Rhopalosiphum maidis]XP_026813250.1 protein atonal homolog 7-like [Rhopalosiphum maidis]